MRKIFSFNTSWEEKLKNFFGEKYGENLPKSDEELYCLWCGVVIAKTTFKIAYTNLFEKYSKFPINSKIHTLYRKEQNARKKLYDECFHLVKEYIMEVKGIKMEGFMNWLEAMKLYRQENEDRIFEQSRNEANKIINVVCWRLLNHGE